MFKAKPPQEDPETKKRREQAEQRAESSRIDETQRDLGRLTDELLRAFGRRTTLGSLAGGAPTFASAGGGGGGGGGSGDGAAAYQFNPLSIGNGFVYEGYGPGAILP